jgi:hypothetical protein
LCGLHCYRNTEQQSDNNYAERYSHRR